MPEHNPWAGLAPTVDAVLGQWAIADRNKHLAAALLNRGTVEALNNARHNSWLWRWLVFGMSYGLPDENGNPTATVVPADAITTDGATITGREQFRGPAAMMHQGAAMALREAVMLSRAVPHYVSAEVMHEVEAMAAAMEPEPLHLTDLQCRHGFAVFEEPLVCPDLDPDTGGSSDLYTHIRGIAWDVHEGIIHPRDNIVRQGVTLFLYTTGMDTEQGYLRSYRDIYGRLPEGWGEDDQRHQWMEFMPIEVIPWSFGVDWQQRPEGYVQHIPGTVPEPVMYQRRWFLAFMRLLWQEIVVHRKPQPKRAEVRRWERMSKRRPKLDYTVLRLRRVVDPDYAATLTGTGVPMEHRVMVRAHPRRQHYPSLGPARNPDGTYNPDSHRLIWIEAHWRGPEDAPIGAMDAATSVTR